MSDCPICGEPVEWCWTTKGRPYALERDDHEGYIYVEEGFAHEFDNIIEACEALNRDGIVHHYSPCAVPLYVAHYCEGEA